MNFGFVTCVQLGLSCMEAIYYSGHHLDVIFTLEDDIAVNKSGRVFVDEFASTRRIPVHKLRHINDSDAVSRIKELDWLFIIGWSQIAGPEVINAPRKGALGIHPTLLPQGRGRAAIPWAILKGLDKTGVTLFKLDEGVDTGPIVAQLEIELTPRITATELYAQVNASQTKLIRDVMPSLIDDSTQLTTQNEHEATLWPGRRPEDGEINIDGSVYDAERLVRAVTRPYPGAFYTCDAGERHIVWSSEISKEIPTGHHLSFSDGYLKILE